MMKLYNFCVKNTSLNSLKPFDGSNDSGEDTNKSTDF